MFLIINPLDRAFQERFKTKQVQPVKDATEERSRDTNDNDTGSSKKKAEEQITDEDKKKASDEASYTSIGASHRQNPGPCSDKSTCTPQPSPKALDVTV